MSERFLGYSLFLTACLITSLQSFASTDPICASQYSELEKTEALRTLRFMIPQTGHRGFVNGTQGSYFYIRTTESAFQFTFLTTGLFDLYGVRRDGEVRFCEIDGKVYIYGLGEEQEIYVDSYTIQFGERTPRLVFQIGPVPELLKRKHDLSNFF